MRVDQKQKVFVEGLKKVEVKNFDEVTELLESSSKIRSTASHNLNEHSSRSHLILTVDLDGKYLPKDTVLIIIFI